MPNKRILVTGAGGFIGLELCNDLAEKGHTVVGIDLHFPPGIDEMPFESHVVDFRESSTLRSLLNGVDVVIHLASAHLKTSISTDEYWDVNVRSIPELLHVVRTEGVSRFIHVSSVGVYGNLKTWPASEETPCFPQSVYGETKLAGENEVKKFSKQWDFPALILRPAWVFGPTCPRTRKLNAALRKGTFVMIGRGTNMRHPVYIDDFLKAVSLAMEYEKAQGDVFLIAGEAAMTSREVIETLCEVMGYRKPMIRIPYWGGKVLAKTVETGFRALQKEPPITTRTLEFFDTHNAFDISKARNKLKFDPEFTFAMGLKRCREVFEIQ